MDAWPSDISISISTVHSWAQTSRKKASHRIWLFGTHTRPCRAVHTPTRLLFTVQPCICWMLGFFFCAALPQASYHIAASSAATATVAPGQQWLEVATNTGPAAQMSHGGGGAHAGWFNRRVRPSIRRRRRGVSDGTKK